MRRQRDRLRLWVMRRALIYAEWLGAEFTTRHTTERDYPAEPEVLRAADAADQAIEYAIAELDVRLTRQAMTVSTVFAHGQFYATVRGPHIRRAIYGHRAWRTRIRWDWWRHGTVSSCGPTPEAAVADAIDLVDSLMRDA